MNAEKRKLKIKQLIIDRLNLKISVDDINDDSALFLPVEQNGLGLDSVDALELAVGIMNTFDVEVSDDDMHIFEYVNTIDQFIADRIVEAS
ncbi:acyl carrier protein [Muricauda sp. MAR_2010_75]|uniref:acyl carrier protein n=1 Tax=Allomuricauda sp. MAR_2010_75 TaxID=1250232 RepID=UPI00056A8199|nr:phosphopantetheine-binding protein [Muricauda sp. MAR_2010_75]